MDLVVKKLTLIVFILFSSLSFAGSQNLSHKVHNDFQFQIQKYHTQRQTGQILNVYVRYALKKGLPTKDYPDYIPMRQVVLNYLEPTAELPANVFWEIVAQKIGDELYATFPIEGVSVQLLVFPSEEGHMFEPGFHGPIYTKGKIKPLNVDPPVQ